MRRMHRSFTDDDVDLDYLSSARSTDRLKNALMDTMDDSFSKSRTADKRLLKDIDNRLDDPFVFPMNAARALLKSNPYIDNSYAVMPSDIVRPDPIAGAWYRPSWRELALRSNPYIDSSYAAFKPYHYLRSSPYTSYSGYPSYYPNLYNRYNPYVDWPYSRTRPYSTLDWPYLRTRPYNSLGWPYSTTRPYNWWQLGSYGHRGYNFLKGFAGFSPYLWARSNPYVDSSYLGRRPYSLPRAPYYYRSPYVTARPGIGYPYDVAPQWPTWGRHIAPAKPVAAITYPLPAPVTSEYPSVNVRAICYDAQDKGQVAKPFLPWWVVPRESNGPHYWTQYGPVEIPTRKVESKTRIYKYPTYVWDTPRTTDTTVSKSKKRLLTTYDYNPPAPQAYADMRSLIRHANDKLDSHKKITDSFADHDVGVPRGGPVIYNYSHYDRPEQSAFSEPPVSDLRRRIRGVISRAKGNPNYYREY